ncbi:flagellar filament capping protein FliD [Deefgea tanakiae]|uniref:Flagellar hook-associated protein 2 n=1 Tax=Deefgea tanakiae TaxID=2865840 RepID=A0ABX8ZDI0_9NEIS|nr:flagellar filament capping protein FliD [Deefgea tanakiae]QZA79200.1 flagellar filament capping protein FliD [Deefgea tanakiae]
MAMIDVNSIVTQLMAVERQPLKKIEVQNIGNNARLSAYGTIKSGLASFQTAAKALSNPESFTTIKANSSASDEVGVSAAKNAAQGSFAVEVTQLAKNQKLASGSFAASTSIVGSGQITFEFGTYSTSGAVTSFTSNADKTSKTITIDEKNNTLAGLRDAINNSGANVTASIVNDGTGYKLALVSKDTGEANSLRITTTDGDGSNTDALGLSVFAYDATANPAISKLPVTNMVQTQNAQNSVFKMDGISVSKSSNVVSDAIDGVTLTLSKITTAPVNISISNDTSGISKAVQAFVKSYNDLSKTLKDLSAYNPETKQGGLLNGDATIRSLQTSLRSALNQVVSGTGSDFSSMSQVGVKTDQNGVLTVDSAKLNAAITKDVQGVISLFATNSRTSDSMIKIDSFSPQTSSMNNTPIAVISNATQASYTSSALVFPPSGFVVDSSNKNFSISINGKTASVNLNEGSYTKEQLAAELQTRVNSNSLFTDAKATINVKIGSDNKIVMTNPRYGSEGSLAINSDLLGTGILNTISGTDVRVKVGGEIKTGVGQQVTLDNGMRFSVLGGAAIAPDGADRGTINFSKGLGYQIDTLIGKMLEKGGVVDARVDGMNTRSKMLADRTTNFNQRMDDVEKRYRAQYAALDVAVSAMQNMSNRLSEMLSKLG